MAVTLRLDARSLSRDLPLTLSCTEIARDQNFYKWLGVGVRDKNGLNYGTRRQHDQGFSAVARPLPTEPQNSLFGGSISCLSLSRSLRSCVCLEL